MLYCVKKKIKNEKIVCTKWDCMCFLIYEDSQIKVYVSTR